MYVRVLFYVRTGPVHVSIACRLYDADLQGYEFTVIIDAFFLKNLSSLIDLIGLKMTTTSSDRSVNFLS